MQQLGFRIARCLLAAALIMGLSHTAALAATEEAGRTAGAPGRTVTLSNWVNSSEDERYAFLIGFLTLLELEDDWQKKAGADAGTSTVPVWSALFEGRTLREIHDAINKYIAAYPNEMNRPVVEVMWFTLARPNVHDNQREPDISRNTEPVRQQQNR